MHLKKDLEAPDRSIWSNHIHYCPNCWTFYTCVDVLAMQKLEDENGGFYTECPMCNGHLWIGTHGNWIIQFDHPIPF